LRSVMAGHVERGAMPGLVALVARHGTVHVEVIGTKAFGDAEPLARDAIFRIASLSKPIAAAAAMLLVDDGTLHLDGAVDDLLPELADRRVLRSLDAALDDTVPAHRPITLDDLLTFRMGFGTVLAAPGTYPIQRAEEELGLMTLGPPWPPTPHGPGEWMRRFGTLPLMCQPGEKWLYNMGSDVLGVLIARATGQPFETLLRERIFEPLGMKDTGFSVPPANIDRLATSYRPNFQTGALEVYDESAGGQWSRPPAFPSGGAGLVSTIDDYLAFGLVLLNHGNHGSERILSRPSVETMTTDQLTPEQKAVSGLVPGYFDGHGWGLGVSVVTRRVDVAGSVGKFGWDGGLGTSWY